MKYVGLMNISLQQIHAFLSVAKHMNMTKAADSIHVTQPLLSQKIASLEYETGVQLFTRSKRKLKITPAGDYLFEQWSHVIEDIEKSVDVARKIQTHAEREIRISFCFGIPVKTTVNIMQKLRQEFPGFEFSFQMAEIFQLRDELLAHRSDLAIAPNYDFDELGGMIRHKAIVNSHINVIAGKGHPLSGRESVQWSDLREMRILCQPASQTGGYETCISNICQTHGFVPAFVQCNNIFSATARMMLGDGIMVGALSPVDDAANDGCVRFSMKEPTIPIVISYTANPPEKLAAIIDRCPELLAAFFQ